MTIYYLCNGKNEKCNGSMGCYKNGGECNRTKDHHYAKHTCSFAKRHLRKVMGNVFEEVE